LAVWKAASAFSLNSNKLDGAFFCIASPSSNQAYYSRLL
jgi:hypothetical protein